MTIYISKDLKEDLQTLAQLDDRSLSNYLTQVLTQYRDENVSKLEKA